MPEARAARTERVVAYALGTGLGIALVLLVAGLMVDLAGPERGPYTVRLSELAAPMPLGARLGCLGILCLGLTPVARVVILGLTWTKQRDWRFAAVAATVLAILAVALAAGVG